MNTLANLNKKLFTELTPTEAATTNGGVDGYRQNIDLFSSPHIDDTLEFYVSPGEDIKLSSFTESGNNTGFIAELQNTVTQQKKKKFVGIGNQTNIWNNVQGGYYKFQFRDDPYAFGEIYGTRGNDSIVINSGNY
jgi:hypothetical protein